MSDRMPSDDVVLTPNKAGSILNVSPDQFRAAFRRKEIPRRIPGKWNQARFGDYRDWLRRKPEKDAIDEALEESPEQRQERLTRRAEALVRADH